MSELPAIDASPRVNPDTLIRHYVVASAISFVVVLALTCFGIYHVSLAKIVANAEDGNVSLATALMDHETSKLLRKNADGTVELKLTEDEFAQVDEAFKDFVHHFAVLKIKVFDRQTRIIYSTDSSIIGRDDKDNEDVVNALAGHIDSEVVAKENVLDFHGQEKFDVDVVETYLPMRDETGRVVGVFELYKDVTPYLRDIRPFVVVSAVIMFIILAANFLAAYVLLRREATELKAAQELLRQQANTDFLSGAFNRRHLIQQCEARMARLKGQGPGASTMCFVMVDVDHFKDINDTHGHAAGDEVIRVLAERFTSGMRQNDFVGRYGGEEFLIVLPDIADDQLKTVVERLWSEIRSKPIRYQDKEIPVTVSLGVAAYQHTDEHLEQIIKRADDALYRAKNEGRDTIRYA
jgi:diguanylate cyclase (GGDEF)-like protein